MRTITRILVSFFIMVTGASAVTLNVTGFAGFDSYQPASSSFCYGAETSTRVGSIGIACRAIFAPDEVKDEGIGAYYDDTTSKYLAAGGSFTYDLPFGSGNFAVGADYLFSKSEYHHSEGRSQTFWWFDDFTRSDHRVLLVAHFRKNVGLYSLGPSLDVWAGAGPAIVIQEGAAVEYGSRPDDPGDWRYYGDYTTLDVGIGIGTLWGIIPQVGFTVKTEYRIKAFAISGGEFADMPEGDFKIFIGPTVTM